MNNSIATAPSYDVSAAQAVLEAERQKRVEECAQQLAAVLKVYHCEMVVRPAFTEDGRITATVQIVAR